MVLQYMLLYAYVLLICHAMQTCYLIEGFSYAVISVLFLAGILLCHAAGMLRNRIQLLRAGLYIALPLLITAAYCKYEFLLDFFQIYYADNFNLINRSIYTTSPVGFAAFLPFFILLLPLAVAFAAAFAGQGRGEITLGILFFFMFSLWNNGFDRALSRHIFFFVMLSILFFAVNQYLRLDRMHRDSGIKLEIDKRKITRYGIIMALIIASTVMAFTRSFGVKSIFQLRKDYELDQRRIMKYAMDSIYGLSSSGYRTSDTGLGGPIQLSKVEALKVKSDRPLYLRGNVKDHYDGFTWKQTSDAHWELGKNNPLKVTSEHIRFMLLDPAAAFSNAKPGQHLVVNKAVIYPQALLTSTLFAPSHTFEIQAKREKIIYDDSNIFILFKKSTRIDDYEVRYYQSETGVELFANLYDLPLGIPYDADSTEPSKKWYYDEVVRKKYARYLQLPPNLSQRTYRLVQSIVRDCRTSKEKVARIQQYLSAHYPYSLTVSHVPPQQEFLDYFLFSEKKGYCTYFATATTVFCRMAGIPARYVEGFNMKDVKDAKGLYSVTNDRAHAWTEILLSPESGIWSIVDCVPEGAEGELLPAPTPYRDKFADAYYQNANIPASSDSPESNTTYSFNLFKGVWSRLAYPLAALPLLLAGAAVLIVLYRLYRLSRTKKRLLGQQSLIPLCRYTAARLKSVHLSLPVGACELEAVQQIEDTCLRDSLELLIRACYQEAYGGLTPGPFDRIKLFDLLEAYIRKRQRFLYYWYFRLFF